MRLGRRRRDSRIFPAMVIMSVTRKTENRLIGGDSEAFEILPQGQCQGDNEMWFQDGEESVDSCWIIVEVGLEKMKDMNNKAITEPYIHKCILIKITCTRRSVEHRERFWHFRLDLVQQCRHDGG